MHLHLQLLHTPALHLADGRVQPLPANDAALLAVLATDGPTAREAMADLLWPDAAGEGARANLRQRLSRWKTRAGLVLQHGSSQLLTLPLLPAGTADANILTLSHDLHNVAERLQADPTAASGELLGDLAYDGNPRLVQWVQRARTQWRSGVIDILTEIAERLEREHHIAQALPYAQRITQDDPLAEHAHRRVMRLHYLRGDRSAALVAYDRLCKLLRDELATVPSHETLDLGRLIESPAGQTAAAGAASALTARPKPLPLVLMRPPRLVGRSDAWDAVQTAWRRRQAVVMVGEPGIGKTRLLSDLVQAIAGAAMQGARPGDATLPYALLQRLLPAITQHIVAPMEPWVCGELARLLPELGEPAQGRLEPLRLQQAVTQALIAARAQGLTALAIDDVQFADAASLELLLRCWSQSQSQSQAGMPELLLSMRRGEQPKGLVDWRAEQPPGCIADIELQSLANDEIVELVDSLALSGCAGLQWASLLSQRTGGNPLFMLQVLVAACDPLTGTPSAAARGNELPKDIHRLIERRLERLTPQALRLARVAALAGADFTLSLVAQVLGMHVIDLTDAVAELEQAQLLLPAGPAYDLVGEALLRTVPGPVAEVLHGNIARALQERGAAPARIAQHWLQAADWPAAATHFELAAAQALRNARRADEMAWEDLASQCHLRAGVDIPAFAARLRAAEAAIVVESAMQVDARVAALMADAEAAHDDSRRLDVLLLRAEQRLTNGDVAVGGPAAEEAFSLARAMGDEGRELRAVNSHGIALALSGHASEGLALFDQLLQRAEAQGEDSIVKEFFSHYGYVLATSGRYREALVPMRRAADLSECLSDLNAAMIEHNNLSAMLGHLGDRDGALAEAEHSLALWRRLGEPTGVPAAASHMTLAVYYMGYGRFAQALERFDWALVQFRTGGSEVWSITAEHHLVRLWLTLGQPTRALQALTPMPADAPTQLQERCKRVVVQANIQHHLGANPSNSIAALRQALVGADKSRPEDRFDMQLMLAVLLPADESLVLCEAIVAEAEQLHRPAMQAALARQADALRRLSRPVEAAAAAQRALAGSAHSGALEMAMTQFWWLLFQAFDAAGERANATTVLERAHAWLRAAEPHVPPAFADSFRHRNPAHRGLYLQIARHHD